ncbi:MAG: glycosyltransferase, partial [Deltaproteobacteria bacterium]|nr:glycosyltransferase [Deltaproteobacteria bacterium]
QNDPAIPFHYDVDDIQPKYADKKALRERLWLRDTFTPILAYVGRLDAQKGVHLLHEAIFYAISHGAQFVLLGSAPDPEINREFWALKAELNDNPDVHIELAYDAELSRLIYAGADIMLVPSNYEPCGLAQLIAMRYGTVPVVRRIGGLVDTVFDREYSDRPEGERNGFVFRDPDRTAITWVLERALRLWYDDPVAFRSLMENGMRQDHSWKEPAQRYLAIYEAALQEAPSV